ncbi:MAG TPA: multicopper oxidase family protein [Thermomicrobiales bacterium]|nr:multicopper oxidase family protein [Thermomicrobiales bacterium]
MADVSTIDEQHDDEMAAGRVTRRRVLTAGAAAAVIGAVRFGGAAAQHDHHATPTTGVDVTPTPDTRNILTLDETGSTGDPGPEGQDLIEPEVREAVNGLLETSLTAAFGATTVNGQPKVSRVYDGIYPGPTLKAKPGDTIRVSLSNHLEETTNLHTHGLHVSPGGNSDNVFVHIEPGETFDYEFNIPEDHTSGLYWYHPHVHGDTFQHVNGGMAGAIILDGGLDEIPGIKGLTERLLVLQSTEFDAHGVVVPVEDQHPRDQLRTINGQLNPTIRLRPGETQRWRIANMTSSNFCLLGLEGHMMHKIADDGNALRKVETLSQLFLSSGERAEVLVQTSKSGTFQLRQLLWGTGGQSQPDVVLATMVVEGEPVEQMELPTTLLPFEDLRDLPVDNHRELRFDVKIDEHGPHFLIDGQKVDMDRVDQTVKLGALEEWTIYNDSSTWHPFHIHINDFQVVAINGEPYEALSMEDTVSLPAFGSVTIRSRFLDFTGKYVYHCHILFHEDNGMMGIVEVVE